MSQKNTEFLDTRFRAYGHVCEFQLPAEEIEELRKTGMCNKILRAWRRVINVDSSSPLTRQYLRSQHAIDEEKYRYKRLRHFAIHPLSQLYAFWQRIYILLVSVGSLTNPIHYYLLEPADAQNLVILALSYVADALCVIDLFLRFIVGFYENFTFNFQRRKIFLNYLKTNFFWILPVTVPYFPAFYLYILYMEIPVTDSWYLYTYNLVCYLNILTSFRFVNVQHIYRELSVTIELDSYCRTVFLMMIWIVYCVIWLSCLFAFTYSNTVTGKNNMFETSVSELFLHNIYRTLSSESVTSSFKENVDSVLFHNTIFGAIAVILYRTLILIALAHVLRLNLSRDSATIEYESMVSQLEYYMSYKKLPEYIKTRMRRYYAYRFNKFYFHEDEIISSTSGQLHQDLIMNNCRLILKNVVLFRKMPYALLQQVVLRLRNEIYTTNEVYIDEN